MFGFTTKSRKRNQIELKLVGNLCILKLLNSYITKENNLNEFEETYKIIYCLLIFFFFHIFLPSYSLKNFVGTKQSHKVIVSFKFNN